MRQLGLIERRTGDHGTYILYEQNLLPFCRGAGERGAGGGVRRGWKDGRQAGAAPARLPEQRRAADIVGQVSPRTKWPRRRCRRCRRRRGWDHAPLRLPPLPLCELRNLNFSQLGWCTYSAEEEEEVENEAAAAAAAACVSSSEPSSSTISFGFRPRWVNLQQAHVV